MRQRQKLIYPVLRSTAINAAILAGAALLALPAIARPVIDMASPKAGAAYSPRAYLDVTATVRDPRGLTSIDILLNGRALGKHATRNIEFRDRILPRLQHLAGATEYPVRFRIPVAALKENGNLLTIRSRNVVGEFASLQRPFRFERAKGTIFVAAIGINNYRQSDVPSLKYAEKDATAIADYFRETVGVPKENIFTLTGRNATARNIKKLLGVTLQRRAGPEDQIVIFYAGHGVPEYDKSSRDPDRVEKYLLPWDGEVQSLYATAIPMREVGYLSQRLGSDRVVFLLDTCFSGAAGARGARTLAGRLSNTRSLGRLDDSFLGRIADARGKVILTASGVNELSQELDSLRHGVFTYYLLQGMKGRADYDSDGIVSVSEIHKYVSAKVSKRTGREQRPTYFASETVTGEIALAPTRAAEFKSDMVDPWDGMDGSGRLVLQASPPNASIYIDGFARGVGFINTELSAGRHTIRIERRGYRARKRSIQISARRLLTLRESLSESRSMPPP